MKMKKSLIALQVASFVCYLTGFVFADSHMSKTEAVEYVKDCINSTPGRRCTLVVFTEKTSKGYTGYVEWDNGARTVLTVEVHGQKIQYGFGNAVRPVRVLSASNHIEKPLNQQRTPTASEDSPEHPIPHLSEQAEDVIIWVYIIGSVVFLGGIIAAIVGFVKHMRNVYDYNILDAGNLASVGVGLSLWIVTPLLVHLEVVPKQGLVLWLVWIGCGLVSVVLFAAMFIRTTSETSFSKAVIAFPIQVVAGPLVILFWWCAILLIFNLIGGLIEWSRRQQRLRMLT